jgi:hypothetical protein
VPVRVVPGGEPSVRDAVALGAGAGDAAEGLGRSTSVPGSLMASSTSKGYGAEHRQARIVVLLRDGEVCQWCGAPAPIVARPGVPAGEADHLGPKIPDPAQMVAACRTCNRRRGGRRRRALGANPGPSRKW